MGVSPSGSEKRRVIILGGGMAALTAAFELTNADGWRDSFDVVVYQMGWRLGGKGASSRNVAQANRIEEHGLHLFFGFYENACRLLRDCYADLGRVPGTPLATWANAFKRHDYVVFEELIGGGWYPWEVTFPRTEGLPGDGGVIPTPPQFLELLLGWLADLVERSRHAPLQADLYRSVRDTVRADVARIADSVGGWLRSVPDHAVVAPVAQALRAPGLPAATPEAASTFVHVAHALAESVREDPTRRPDLVHTTLPWLLKRFRDWLETAFGPVLDRHAELRHLFILLDLGVAASVGMLRDDIVLPPHDWSSIDHLDFRAWLRKHGAAERTVHSTLVNTLYGLVFAEHTEVGAGLAMYDTLRLCFTYKGSTIWKMQAGMGETVFAPLYQVLRKRGVRFEFFHRVDALRLAPGTRRIGRIEMGRQATVKGGGEYDALIDVGGLPCWPGTTDYYDRLEEAEALKRGGYDLEDWWAPWPDVERVTVEVNPQDVVVLGISIGMFPYICADLMGVDSRFRAMVEKLQTTQTRGLQLWLGKDLRALGWSGPQPVLGNYTLPYDTWADMTHLLDREQWPAAKRPKNLAYVCGDLLDDEPVPPRSDHGYPERQRNRVGQESRDWLESAGPALWPGAAAPNGRFDWQVLVDPEERQGEARFAAQYWRATVNPSERYVLSAPGTARYRLRAGDSGFENLVLAGDWTRTIVNAGCIEAATMSGMHASRAICGRPATVIGDVED